jgi:hypothetical protein
MAFFGSCLPFLIILQLLARNHQLTGPIREQPRDGFVRLGMYRLTQGPPIPTRRKGPQKTLAGTEMTNLLFGDAAHQFHARSSSNSILLTLLRRIQRATYRCHVELWTLGKVNQCFGNGRLAGRTNRIGCLGTVTVTVGNRVLVSPSPNQGT